MRRLMRPDESVPLRALKRHGCFVWRGGKNDPVPAQDGFEGYCDVKYVPPRKPLPAWGGNGSWRGEADSET